VNCVRRSERKEELAENMQAKQKTAANITMREERKDSRKGGTSSGKGKVKASRGLRGKSTSLRPTAPESSRLSPTFRRAWLFSVCEYSVGLCLLAMG
jgi:hypothetical protein